MVKRLPYFWLTSFKGIVNRGLNFGEGLFVPPYLYQQSKKKQNKTPATAAFQNKTQIKNTSHATSYRHPQK